jgi:hypothetical protein
VQALRLFLKAHAQAPGLGVPGPQRYLQPPRQPGTVPPCTMTEKVTTK